MAKKSEEIKKKKKKVVVEEAPAKKKKKKVVEEAAPVKKKKKVADEAPAKKKKKKVEEKSTKKAKKTKAVKERPVYAPIKEKFKKTSLVEHLAEACEVDKKVIKSVLEEIELIMCGAITKKGIGEFQWPTMFKIVTKHIAAKKGGEKKKSPFTGEMIITKAKPATVRVKIRPLKKLKDAALPPTK